MKKLISRETLETEFKKIYGITPTSLMLKQYEERRPTISTFSLSSDDRKLMRKKVPALINYRTYKKEYDE